MKTISKQTSHIAKQLAGEYYYLGGNRAEIEGLHISAYNWNAIDGENDLIDVGPEFAAFMVHKDKLVQWRANIESFRFDADRIITPLAQAKLTEAAQQWIDSIPTERFMGANPVSDADFMLAVGVADGISSWK